MPRPDLTITVLFAAILPVFFLMPWISIIEGLPIALSGVGLAFGQYNIQPTEYYALASAITACAGTVVPNVMPKNKTLARTYLALTGVGVTILMQVHAPEGFQGVEWRMGYWMSLLLFAVTAFYSVYVLGRVHERTRRRRPWRR